MGISRQVTHFGGCIKKNSGSIRNRSLVRWATTYSPTKCSTIGAGRLNFSVRNGKRWNPAAIVTCFPLGGFSPKIRLDMPERKKLIKQKTNPEKNCRAISTARLRTLPPFHLQPINVVVFYDPLWRSNLEVSFALRCFQRLSHPDIATQLCSWRNNWYTRGLSNTVLSY